MSFIHMALVCVNMAYYENTTVETTCIIASKSCFELPDLCYAAAGRMGEG